MIRHKTAEIKWTTPPPRPKEKIIGVLTIAEERVKDEDGDEYWIPVRYVFVKALRRLNSGNEKGQFVWKYGGYGIQKEVFDRLVKDFPEGWVYIVEKDTKETLVASFARWQQHGVVDTLHKKSGEQIFLAEEYMFKLDKRGKIA